jgi:hypothetical protein
MDTNESPYAVYILRSKTILLSAKQINDINNLKKWAIPDVGELDPKDRRYKIYSNIDALPYLLALRENNKFFKMSSNLATTIFEEDLVKIFEIFMLSRLYSEYYFKDVYPHEWELNYVMRQKECFEI